MQFLSMASAWFALALPAIAMMYILKKTYQSTEIASHLLWRRVLHEQEANRPWRKLRSRWLLLLQLLAALLLVLALMEPVLFRSQSDTGHAVLLIDRSASMTARPLVSSANTTEGAIPDTETLLELAIKQAVSWLNEQPRNRPITIVTTGAQPEVIANRALNREQLIDQLQSIVPYYGHSDNAAALSLADSLHQGEAAGMTLVFTDGYWKDAAEANTLRLQTQSELLLTNEETQRNNVSILYFGITEGQNGSRTNLGLITVQNDSDRERRIAVDVYVEDEDGVPNLAAEASVVVAAGEWQSVQVDGLPYGAYYKAQLRDNTDDILIDNALFQFPAVQRTMQALVVTKGNLFLEKALLLAGVRTVKISPDNAAPTGEQAAAMDWILVDGMEEHLLTDADWTALLDSKPLWMIDHPSEDDNTSVTPAHGRVESKEHPVTTFITLSDTHIGRLAQPDASQLSWGEPVLTYGGVPAIYAGMAEGLPKLRFTFNLQDTDLPLRPEFPVLIVQAAEWMSGGTQLELGSTTAGQSVDISLHSETVTAQWEALQLTGAGLPFEQNMLNKPVPLNLQEASMLTVPHIPGLYRLVERNGDNEIVGSRLLAVTVDYGELSSTDEAGNIKLSLNSQDGSANEKPNGSTDGKVNLPSEDSLSEESSEEHRSVEGNHTDVSLQMWAAIIVLLLMAAEWEVYRRGHSS